MMTGESYPGDSASPAQVRALADEYRGASDVLGKLGRKGEPLSRAPFRLTAIHAIELYLHAVLLARGRDPRSARGLGHRLSERAKESGLCLRERTLEHLRALDANREYLTSRYCPEFLATASQINRLKATLDEVAKKATVAITLAGAQALKPKSSAQQLPPPPTPRRARSCR